LSPFLRQSPREENVLLAARQVRRPELREAFAQELFSSITTFCCLYLMAATILKKASPSAKCLTKAFYCIKVKTQYLDLMTQENAKLASQKSNQSWSVFYFYFM